MKKFIASAIIFALLSIGAIVFMTMHDLQNAKFTDGTYTGIGGGRNGPIELSVSVKGGRIKNVDIVSQSEDAFAKAGIKHIIEQAIKKQSLDEFDIKSGATLTSNGTIKALQNALAPAMKNTNLAPPLKPENTETDIVIIGAGGAGLAAAIEAESKGAKVIVVEKMAIIGGNTNSATGGLNASETSVQKSLGIADSNEQFVADTMKGGYNKNDRTLVETLAKNSAATVDWLLALGVDLRDVGKLAGSTNKRAHRPQGGKAVGPHLIASLSNYANAKKIDIRTNTKATSIINENGKAAGITVECQSGKYEIRAKAVIIATGGFGANPAMVEKYAPSLKGFGTTNHKGATGDAFEWIKSFDGALVQMNEIQTHPTVIPENGFMITEAVRGNGAILINRAGKRFVNEMKTRDVVSKAILKEKGASAFLFFDESVKESLAAIDTYKKQGLLTEAGSIAELAQKLNIDATSLEASIARYNTSQSSGTDSEFGRSASDMPRALSTPPFYAVEVAPAIHHTMGGIKINEKCEVQNTKGKSIPCLYAAGEVTGGIHGGNRLGGNAVADICVFGKLAADNAVESVLKD